MSKTVGILQFNPQTFWRQGGGELHAGKYVQLLKRYGYNAEVFDFASAKKYDIIHYFGANFQLAEIGQYAQKEGIKVVGTPILFPSSNVLKYQAFLMLEKFLPFPTTLGLRKKILHDSDLLIANTIQEKNYLVKAYGADSSLIHVLGTGVDEVFFNYVPDRNELPEKVKGINKYVLIVGRVTPLKAQLSILRTLKDVDCKVVICGKPDPYDDSYTSAVQDMVDTNPDRFIWLKGLNPGSNELKALYAFAACHILYSDTDVAPLVNIEAAALGTMVISKAHITVKEIMKDTATLVENDQQLSDAVKYVYGLSELQREKRIQALRNLVEQNYTWEKIVEDTAKLYDDLIKHL